MESEVTLGSSQLFIQIEAGFIEKIKEVSKCSESMNMICIIGKVVEVGSSVINFAKNDRVTGLLSCCIQNVGLSSTCLLEEAFTVSAPERISAELFAALLPDALSAFVALHTLAKMKRREKVLILNFQLQNVVLQLARQTGAEVYVLTNGPEIAERVDTLPNCHAIDISLGDSLLPSRVLDETGGVGVDIILDTTEESSVRKRDILSMLAVNGRWIVNRSLQLDPPESELLIKRSGSLCFLNPFISLTASGRGGTTKHIIDQVVSIIATGGLQPISYPTVRYNTIENQSANLLSLKHFIMTFT